MKKFFITLLVFVLLFFNSQLMFAANSEYKNNLLKIEITKIDDDNYNIELYTQKNYNEPVKVIKKSDTLYYFLLPETSHSITSVAPVGDIENVLVKLYPYAGQDLNNGYTKVAIITTKSLNLSTSLKTLDSSVSPRLNPLRLAKLDEVFEKYAQRLAENNVSTQLAEFKKNQTDSSLKTDKLASNTHVKTAVPIVATAENADSLNVQTPAKNAVVKQTKTVENNGSNLTSSKTSAVSTPGNAIASIPKSTAVKTASVQKPNAAIKKTTSAPSVKKEPAAPGQQIQKTSAQSENFTKTLAESSNQIDTPVQKKAVVDSSDLQKKSEASKNDIITQAKTSEYEKQLPNPKPTEVEFTNSNTIEDTPPQDENKVVKGTASLNTALNTPQDKQNNNLNLLFLSGLFIVLLYAYVKVKNKNAQKAQKAAYTAAQDARNTSMKELLKNKIAPENSSAIQTQDTVQHVEQDVPVVSSMQQEQPAIQPVDDTQYDFSKEILEALDDISQPEQQIRQEETVSQPIYRQEPKSARPSLRLLNEVNVSDIPDSGVIKKYDVEEFEPMVRVLQQARANSYADENEKINAFNAYMDSINQNAKKTTSQAATSLQTDEDTVLQELCTPIEAKYSDTDSAAIYSDVTAEYDSPAPDYADTVQDSFPDVSKEDDADDTATIVSSSKLTETRGFYLAKFEGATSLVGYIQDDVYVLYNFGEEQIDNTNIQSTLAQENETDSFYIVKTAGKKLMVKSTPYDMSLEMIM